jgi:hypothetical protein
MRTPRFTSFLLITLSAVVIALSACTDGAPTSPSSEITLDKAGNPDSVKHSLEAQLNQERKRLKRLAEQTKAQFDSANREWAAYQKQHTKKGPGVGSLLVTLLRCQPQPYTGDAEIIGPQGGTIHFGRNSLVIPRGALSQPTVITGEQPTGSLVEAQFSPHGLQFQTSATLTISYEHCIVPTSQDNLIVYLGLGHQLLEFEPSRDDKSMKAVQALIDHFSGYAVAY